MQPAYENLRSDSTSLSFLSWKIASASLIVRAESFTSAGTHRGYETICNTCFP